MFLAALVPLALKVTPPAAVPRRGPGVGQVRLAAAVIGAQHARAPSSCRSPATGVAAAAVATVGAASVDRHRAVPLDAAAGGRHRGRAGGVGGRVQAAGADRAAPLADQVNAGCVAMALPNWSLPWP